MAITLDGSNASTVGVPNLATAKNSTSGTSVDFTGIPAGVKRITVMFAGVSTSGNSLPLIQIGTSSGYTTSGYTANVGGGAGFGINSGAAANTFFGVAFINNVGSNQWAACFTGFVLTTNISGAGYITLSGTLDRVRITTVNGTDTFDAGTINILYE